MDNHHSYDSFAHTFSQSRENHYWPEISHLLARMERMSRELARPLRVLDIGCGNGRFLEWYDRENYTFLGAYLGIDSSSGMIEEARSLHPEYHFSTHSMLDLRGVPSEDHSWDILLFLASFHHLDSSRSRLSVLSRSRTLISREGLIMMTNWNLLDQSRYVTSHLGNGDFSIKIGAYHRYYHGFSLEELRQLFCETGWQIEEHRIVESQRNILSILTQGRS